MHPCLGYGVVVSLAGGPDSLRGELVRLTSVSHAAFSTRFKHVSWIGDYGRLDRVALDEIARCVLRAIAEVEAALGIGRCSRPRNRPRTMAL